jgi:phosphoribosylanthranilate isomerase
MRAKICGITNYNDVLFAAQKGAWALGFNFYPKSPRYIEQNTAKNIIDSLPLSVTKVGLFIDKSYDFIARYVDELNLDLVQIYDDLSEAPQSFKDKAILCFQPNSIDELPEFSILEDYRYLLIDAPKNKDGLMGGTGRVSNWELASKLAKDYRLILAGGLNPNNVAMAINIVKPYAVDVASSVESKPGIKDNQLIKNFLKECNHD